MRAACAAALLAAARLSHADGNLWIATGEAYEDDYYLSLGALVPFRGSALGNGWAQRYWVDTYTYSYETGPRRIDADVWGAEAMVGYQASAAGRSGAAYLRLRYSNTTLTPDDPASELRGGQFWPRGQLEGELALNALWRANGIVSYTFGLDGYWTRARFLRNLRDARFIGPELIAQGDPNYSAVKAGIAFGGLQPLPGVLVTLKAGYRWQSGADSPYAGVEMVGQF